MENSLASALYIADAKAKYDENIKNILSDKEILAWLLKNAATEFADLTIEEIIDCIEGEPEISTVEVNPGETNKTEESSRKIIGTKNEDKVPNEGTIYYDFQLFIGEEGYRCRDSG